VCSAHRLLWLQGYEHAAPASSRVLVVGGGIAGFAMIRALSDRMSRGAGLRSWVRDVILPVIRRN